MQTETIDIKCIKTDCAIPHCTRHKDIAETNESTKSCLTVINILGSKGSKLSSDSMGDNVFDPMSPSSSSTTSQDTSGVNDATFEPTIEMMVNDFDDEQTLNEEEALAALEAQDPQDEINTLKEEGEMPLEQLLAKYQALSSAIAFSHRIESTRKKSKKSKKRKKYKHKENSEKERRISGHSEIQIECVPETYSENMSTNKSEIIIIESGDEKETSGHEHNNEDRIISSVQSVSKFSTPDITKDIGEFDSLQSDATTIRHKHLMDLYPKGTFDNVVIKKTVVHQVDKDIPLEILYKMVDDDDELEDEDYDDYKKKIMVGPMYQAIIPIGLSQYGDVLPYENEDKLIWEPSQVSETEVEEYLLKTRDIKPNLDDDDDEIIGNEEYNTEDISTGNGDGKNVLPSTFDGEASAVVKDNEQALHLLVQCGYDFKEALRRKRLNALPLNDTMSLWSEEECQKFEEGIQLYGKDFLKIRQFQVRTRTMRELVQFYYLWKKSERRDQNFANADTVDHMDIYLNEDNEYGANPSSSIIPAISPAAPIIYAATRRNSSATFPKSISIMTGAINSNMNASLLVNVSANTALDNPKQTTMLNLVNTAVKRRPSNSSATAMGDSLPSDQNVTSNYSK